MSISQVVLLNPLLWPSRYLGELFANNSSWLSLQQYWFIQQGEAETDSWDYGTTRNWAWRANWINGLGIAEALMAGKHVLQ